MDWRMHFYIIKLRDYQFYKEMQHEYKLLKG